MKKVLLVTACFNLLGCQAFSDVGNQAVDVLKGVNAALSGNYSKRTLDTATQQSITSALNEAPLDKNTKSLFNEAKPTLNNVLRLISCEEDDKLRAYQDESSVGMAYPTSPVRQMSQHKSGCVHVQKVDSIKKKSENSFSFRTIFISPQSKQTFTGRYTAVKQPDNTWLFNWSRIDAL